MSPTKNIWMCFLLPFSANYANPNSELTVVSFNGLRPSQRYWEPQIAGNHIKLKPLFQEMATLEMTVCFRFLLRYSSDNGFFKSEALSWQITRLDKKYGRVKINDKYSLLYDFGNITPSPGKW